MRMSGAMRCLLTLLAVVTPVFVLPLTRTSFAAEGPSTRPTAADPSVSPMRAVIDEYVVDRGSLSRFYNIEQSKGYRDRLAGFFEDRANRLKDVDFDALDQPGRIDYLLLRTELRRKQAELTHDRHQGEEVSWLLPFAEPVAKME